MFEYYHLRYLSNRQCDEPLETTPGEARRGEATLLPELRTQLSDPNNSIRLCRNLAFLAVRKNDSAELGSVAHK